MPIPWNDDPPRSDARIIDNLKRIGGQVVGDAALRLPPTVAMARDWHREVCRGMSVPEIGRAHV